MSATFDPLENPTSTAQYGREGFYDSTATDGGDSLRVQLGEHLNTYTRRSLERVGASGGEILSFIKRNPVPLLLAAGAIALLVVARSRRRSRVIGYEFDL